MQTKKEEISDNRLLERTGQRKEIMEETHDSNSVKPLLELNDVSFQYIIHRDGNNESKDKKHNESNLNFALNKVNLSIYTGGFVGIIGPSGAGKTTLASLFSGAIPHHYSDIFLEL